MSTERFELQRWECLDLLRSAHIGRICIIDHGYPLALPVNYRLVGTESEPQVVMRTSAETLLGRYGGPASLEADMIDEAAGEAWSVIVRGQVRHVSGAHGLPDPGPWLIDDRHHWVALDLAAISGRRFIGRAAPDGVAVDWELRKS